MRKIVTSFVKVKRKQNDQVNMYSDYNIFKKNKIEKDNHFIHQSRKKTK